MTLGALVKRLLILTVSVLIVTLLWQNRLALSDKIHGRTFPFYMVTEDEGSWNIEVALAPGKRETIQILKLYASPAAPDLENAFENPDLRVGKIHDRGNVSATNLLLKAQKTKGDIVLKFTATAWNSDKNLSVDSLQYKGTEIPRLQE